MQRRAFVGGTMRIVAVAIVLSLASTPSALAMGDDNGRDWSDEEPSGSGDRPFCPNKHVLVRIDEKICPEKPGSPAIVRKRACCRHGDTTNCHPFRPCPPLSRS